MILKYLSKNFYINLMIIISIFLIDRISKIYVVNIDKTLIDSDLFNSAFLNISLVWNSGIAFGLLSISQSNLYNFITALIFVIILFLLILLSKAKNLQKYSYLIIIGGGLGNLFDRIFYKAVPDFIDIHYNGFHWFIFNIADIFITFGVICLIYDEVFLQKSENEK
jgi:signal peptidase II|tara:strand:- start:310 stop:807 length:498 start_codon:yes stop_codon:yes gene_type:complete